MARTLYLVSAGERSGLTTVALGLFHALDRHGIPVGFCKPIAQLHASDTGPERSTHLIRSLSSLRPPIPLALSHAEEMVGSGQEDTLLEEAVARYQQAAVNAEVVVVEGLAYSRDQPYSTRINIRIARALDADIIIVAAPGNWVNRSRDLQEAIEITARPYGGVEAERLLGCIFNLVDAPVDDSGRLRFDFGALAESEPQKITDFNSLSLFQSGEFRLLGSIPWRRDLIIPRVRDVVDFASTAILNQGDLDRRVTHVVLGARSVPEICEQLVAGAMLMTPGDRHDLLLAAATATMNGIPLAAVMLTDDLPPDPRILQLCRPALEAGLPLLAVPRSLLTVVLSIPDTNLEVPLDDQDRIQRVTQEVAANLDLDWIDQSLTQTKERRLSPPAFRYRLVEEARHANKRIVLPEGDEPRTIRAAAICQARGIARCVLLGNRVRIQTIAAQNGVVLPPGIEILDPVELAPDYVDAMVVLRHSKGLTAAEAEEQLQDPVVVGTMMLALDHVDGLVSGAVHTTANTIRPALQLVRTAPAARLVSSIFFMCLPEQVLVYGDCAVNPDPNAEDLADIAIQSADSAQAFGIPPRVAMLSYSTGSSGSGSDVEKVREATRIARQQRPDLLIDGPLQYDAAAIKTVGESKAPGSQVAGRATVFIFPDLNTGNTTYKAVQRSAEVISIGPMLQGMAKPVNDLSRGALVEDIVFTIALTAIQAVQRDRFDSAATGV